MSGRRYRREQIVRKLREAQVERAKGRSVGEVAKHLGITDQTYDRWRKEYGGPKTDQAKRLRELERENTRPRRVVADLREGRLPGAGSRNDQRHVRSFALDGEGSRRGGDAGAVRHAPGRVSGQLEFVPTRPGSG